MLPSIRKKWVRLCTKFALDDGSTPVATFIKNMPRVSSCRYAELIALSQEIMLQHFPEEGVVPQDFDGVALFSLLRGSEAIESASALYVFQHLVVGGGRFGSLYEGPRDQIFTCTNQRQLVVPASSDPWDTKKVPVPSSHKRAHLDLSLSEVLAGRCLGPFNEDEAQSTFGNYSVVQSFVLSKPTAISTKLRLVHNFSYQHHHINNMLADLVMLPVDLDHSARFIAAARARAAHGELLHMVTADVSKGYRRLFHRRQDVAHLGLRIDVDFDGSIPFFDGSSHSTRSVKKGDAFFIFDRSLPFGLKTSVSSFCAVSSLVRDFVQEKLGAAATCMAYIDDFVILGPKDAVARGITLLREVLQTIGLPENPLKMNTPSSSGTYLGINYDFSDPWAVSLTLPPEKKARYIKHLEYYISKAEKNCPSAPSLAIPRTELQSLVGKVCHAAYVFQSGRPFYARLLYTLRSGGKRLTLSSGAIDDLRWWVSVLTNHSGTVILHHHQIINKIYTDASTSTGFGAIFNGNYFHGTWSSEVSALVSDFHITINELELVTLNFALETWGSDLAGSTVHFRCDNLACVYNIASMSSKIPIRAALLRRLYATAAHYGITLQSSYINTHDNLHADTLSRGKMQEFFDLPQHHSLVAVSSPVLSAMGLLTNPHGPQNPSSPAWLHSHFAGSKS
jgi:hypothetical protein